MTHPIPLVAPGFSLFEQNIPLAIAIVVVASFLFAGGATIQHLAVGHTIDKGAENRSMNLTQILGLLSNKRWLLGLATVATGATMHIVGLMMAPVTVVQPVGILAVPWSVLLAAKIHHFRPTKVIWGAVALTIVGHRRVHPVLGQHGRTGHRTAADADHRLLPDRLRRRRRCSASSAASARRPSAA